MDKQIENSFLVRPDDEAKLGVELTEALVEIVNQHIGDWRDNHGIANDNAGETLMFSLVNLLGATITSVTPQPHIAGARFTEGLMFWLSQHIDTPDQPTGKTH